MSLSGSPRYVCRRVTLPSSGETRRVIIDQDGAFHEEATAWLQYLAKVDTGSPNTSKSYGSKLAAYLTWMAAHGFAWREPSLSTMSLWRVHAMTRPLESGRRKGSPPEPNTAALYVRAVLAFYKWAGGVADLVDPALVTSFFRWQQLGPGRGGGESGTERLVLRPELTVKVPERAPEWIPSQKELQAVLDVPMKPRDWFLVVLLFTTGIRIGEALSLFRSDMHLTASSIGIGCAKSGPHIHVHNDNETRNGERTKDKRGRIIAVTASLVHAHEDYRHERAEILGATDDNPHVFVNLYASRRGEAVKADSLRDLFERLSRVSGITLTAHTFRHTRASWWLHGVDCAKADARSVQELMGHASLATTNGYLHTTDERLRAVVESTAPLIRGESANAGGLS